MGRTMLTRMRIVNIQKHKDLELLLDKINVIVGATDSGKTSVLRALTWALTNDDAGENLNRSSVYPTVAEEMKAKMDEIMKNFKSDRRGLNEEYYK